MKTNVRRADRPRRAQSPAAFIIGASIVVGALAAAPASAQQLPPLPLETGLDIPLTEPIEDVTGLITDVPEQLGGVVVETTNSLTAPRKDPRPLPTAPTTTLTDPWSIDHVPGLQSPSPAREIPTSVSGASYRRPVSYGSAIGGGFRSAVQRAASLAGPLAAPIALALVAVGLLAVAAQGPGRLVKVEEERQSFRERRHYRL